MDRDDIERTDFPAARRGYDPAAVHEHLRRVADGFDALASRPAGGLAAETSEQVRAILEAAEHGAEQLRADAGREATGHVEHVEAAAKDLLGRLDALHAELDRLLEGLKGTAASLTGSLEALSRDVGTLGGAAAAPPAPPSAESPAPTGSSAAPPLAESPAPTTNGAARSGDEAGARLVALNMALEGTPREETAAFLAEHYEVADLDALLDEVYASAGR